MNIVNWDTYKFHASSIKNLMVTSRSKSDPLSETTKSFLQEIYIQEVYGRKKPITTPAMQKGTMAESDGLDLIYQVTGKLYFKNQEQVSNEFVTGTADIKDKEQLAVRDMKLSWDIWTFMKSDEETARKDYYWQILSYGWMEGYTKGSIFYALVNTPDILMRDELYRQSFKMPEDEVTKLEKNYIYDDIPAKDRLKQFDFDFKPEDIDLVKNKVLLSRDYLKGMHL